MSALPFTALNWLTANNLRVGHKPPVQRGGELLLPCAFFNNTTLESFDFDIRINYRLRDKERVDEYDLLLYLVGASQVLGMTHAEFNVAAGQTMPVEHYVRAQMAGKIFTQILTAKQLRELVDHMWPKAAGHEHDAN